MNRQRLTGLSSSHLKQVNILGTPVTLDPLIESDFLNLVHCAHDAGFELEVASGFRDFQRQKQIWNSKFLGKTPLLDSNSQPLDYYKLSETERLFSILRWSAIPGGSRHHWGTDLDIFARNLLPTNIALKLEPWEYLEGHQAPFYDWLVENIHRFGFFFPYHRDLGGVAPEPWHISHQVSASHYLESLTQSILLTTLNEEDLLGLPTILNHFDEIYSRFISNIFKG
jgi:LAS superfamily LD-carboxypeptidase LdcB